MGFVPVSTTVLAVAARSIGYDTFADLLPDGCRVESVRKEGALLAVTFDADLEPAVVQAIRDRMTSRDDADQAERARIAAALDGGATNLARMWAQRELGRPVEEPVYPAPE